MVKGYPGLIGALLVAALGFATLEWTDLVSDDGGFQVRMPVPATRQARTQVTEDGETVVQHYYVASHPSAGVPRDVARLRSE